MPFQKDLVGGKIRPPKVYGGGILRHFEKTPRSIVCPHFWELNWAYGCPLDCSYCYLQGTLRGHKEPRARKLSRVFTALEKFFKDSENGVQPPTVFNSGELTDSLAFPSKMREIADKFEEQNTHKLLILTKITDNVGFLVEKPREQTIVSFSINAPEAAERWEKAAPPIKKRIEAARKVKEAGYETRIRIDPMAPIKNWSKHYLGLVDQLFNSLIPDRITLGTLRGLWKTIKFCEDDSWTKYLTEAKTGWGKKVEKDTRYQMYATIKRYLEEGYDYSKVALCKETPEIWRKLGEEPGSPPEGGGRGWEGCKCNCVW